LITDEGIHPEDRATLEKLGGNVIVVQAKGS